MATWAVGDVQGCFVSLQALLHRIGWDPGRDRLWLCGDLVNRGAASLATLRFCRDAGPGLRAVLGNHDLHLLARAAGVVGRGRRETLDDILAAEDRDSLLAWLTAQPLLHVEDDAVFVHGGLLPQWTVAEARAWAERAQRALRGPDAASFVAAVRHAGHLIDAEAAEASTEAGGGHAEAGVASLAAAADALTRLRCCDEQGRLHRYAGPLEGAPEGFAAWFDLRRARHGAVAEGRRVYAGHWAALGLRVDADVIHLDSGCVWGERLTAICVETGQIEQVEAAPEDLVEGPPPGSGGR
jgi:bis(5'-nucleosyl)-tetraphosphatase (symmetrical)